MMETTDNLVLEHLRQLRAAVDASREDMRELKGRMTSVEIAVGNMAATEAAHYGTTASRLDRIEGRLDRIERRLELTEA